MRKIILLGILFLFVLDSNSQDFTREDSLRGFLNPFRTCYDVTYYDLFVIVDEKERTLERSYNTIHFTSLLNMFFFPALGSILLFYELQRYKKYDLY